MKKKFCPIAERRIATSSTPAKIPCRKDTTVCPLTGGKCKGCVII